MNRKILVGLLVLVIVLGSVGGFWARPAQANTGNERRVMLCAAEPWHEGEWNKVAPPPPWNVTPANFPTDSLNTGDRPGLQMVQQKPQKSLWSRLQFFLFNLRLLLGSK